MGTSKFFENLTFLNYQRYKKVLETKFKLRKCGMKKISHIFVEWTVFFISGDIINHSFTLQGFPNCHVLKLPKNFHTPVELLHNSPRNKEFAKLAGSYFSFVVLFSRNCNVSFKSPSNTGCIRVQKRKSCSFSN